MSLRLSMIEFPADDPERARRFWSGVLGTELDARAGAEGEGWQTHEAGPAVGVHPRGRGPGDTFSLPYFSVSDLDSALEQVRELGGTVIHPGSRWAICKDSEGSPFGLARAGAADAADASGSAELPDRADAAGSPELPDRADAAGSPELPDRADAPGRE